MSNLLNSSYYADIIKTKDLKVNNPHESSSFPYKVLIFVKSKNQSYKFSVETKDMNGDPDCKIGHFGLNAWIRPKKAQDINFTGYKTVQSFSKAVINCINHNKNTVFLGWVDPD